MRDDKDSRERIPIIEIIGWISAGWVYRVVAEALGWVNKIKEFVR